MGTNAKFNGRYAKQDYLILFFSMDFISFSLLTFLIIIFCDKINLKKIFVAGNRIDMSFARSRARSAVYRPSHYRKEPQTTGTGRKKKGKTTIRPQTAPRKSSSLFHVNSINYISTLFIRLIFMIAPFHTRRLC